MNFESPEKNAGKIVFVIFLMLMIGWSILVNHFKVFAKAPDDTVTIIKTIAKVDVEEDWTLACEENNLINDLSVRILNQLIICRKRSDGGFLYAKYCRDNLELCKQNIDEYSRYIIKYSSEFGIDPWLSAAVAGHESLWNAYTVGSKGEKGIFQLLPYAKWGKQSHFVQSRDYRKLCRTVPGHCQEIDSGLAIDLLSKSKDTCKSIPGALAMYNTGKCKKTNKTYIATVLRKQKDLKENNVLIGWCTGGEI